LIFLCSCYFSIIHKAGYKYGSEFGGSSVPSAMESHAGFLLILCHLFSLPCRAQVLSPVKSPPLVVLLKTKSETMGRFRSSQMFFKALC